MNRFIIIATSGALASALAILTPPGASAETLGSKVSFAQRITTATHTAPVSIAMDADSSVMVVAPVAYSKPPKRVATRIVEEVEEETTEAEEEFEEVEFEEEEIVDEADEDVVEVTAEEPFEEPAPAPKKKKNELAKLSSAISKGSASLGFLSQALDALQGDDD